MDQLVRVSEDVRLPADHVLRIAHEYEAAGRYVDAEALLRPVLQAAPDNPDALHLMGLVAYRQERKQDGVLLIEQAVARDKGNPLYFRNLCTIYEELGRHDDAIRAGQRAITLDPYDAQAWHNLSVTHYRLLHLEDSVGCAKRAIALAPDLAAPHLGLAEALLLRGDLQAGWDEYEWRFRVPGASEIIPRTDRPQWDGTPLPDATLLLIADQGFGDVLQFCRYIPWAAQLCPNVALACGPELRTLMRHNFPMLRVFDRWDQCPDFAAYCPLSGLPRLHGTRLDSIPAAVPYLRADRGLAAAWKARLDGLVPPDYFRVGIVWSGRPKPPNRSVSLAALAPLAALDNVALISLQLGSAQNEIGTYYGHAPLIALGHEISDFMDSAALVAGLDLVVSVDTAAAHLAGALGKPVHVMLPFSPDWRWLLGRDDSPWYPTACLFRQDVPRQWGPVLLRVADQIAQLVADWRSNT